MLPDLNNLFTEETDQDQVNHEILRLCMENNTLLKMILVKLTKDDDANDIISEYESLMAELYIRVINTIEKKDE
ncbi:hypothetical protein ORI89_18665 [Sphingobacterium sp. UT-1RO-CII-1]|nr:hypothetical protein [Sphingobacterium sp. UT-1RO-CII-1]